MLTTWAGLMRLEGKEGLKTQRKGLKKADYGRFLAISSHNR